MHQRTDLAAGLINGHDRLIIELVKPPDLPAAILIKWPRQPSVTTPQSSQP